MDKKNESDSEPVHSLWSQDTEAISIHSEENNLSLDISSSVLLLDPEDSDQSGRNVPTTTACSTPHESKLASSSKRKFESSSDDLSPKKRKISTALERALSPVCVPTSHLSASNGNEITNSSDVFSEMQARSKIIPIVVKKPLVVSAEANSSSSTEVASLKSSESEVHHSTNGKQQKLPKQKNQDKDPKKESKIKNFTEEFVCTISYIVDEARKDIISLYVREVNRHLCDTKNASNKLSLSSGMLADISGSEGGSVHSGIEKFSVPSKLSVTSSSSLSSVSSSSSSLPSTANRLHSFNKFLIPQVSELKKPFNYGCKGRVCQCFCSKFVNCLLKPFSSPRCLTPEILSSSSENLKTDSQEFPDHQHDIINKPLSKDELKKILPKESYGTVKYPSFSSRSSIYIPTSENLPVFAKWPGNSWFYPGIIENADEETWHTNKHLEVKFCDGTMRKTLTANLFPAYLLPTKTKIIYEKDGNSETKIMSSVNKLPNNEMLLVAESGESIAFQKICFSAANYKELLKEHSSVLTPRKTPKFSLDIDNVQQGKRIRKIIKTVDSSKGSKVKLKFSSSAKKTPSFRKIKGKRVRSSTDSSSTDHAKVEKKIKSLGLIKPQIKEDVKELSTPHLGELGKKEIARKLYLETPGCSYKMERETKIYEEEASTDPESSGNQEIVFDSISSPNLDVEMIPNIPRRHIRTKNLKKQIAFHQKNKENFNKLGPLPKTELFSNYNFVLTHSKKKPKPIQKLSDDQSYSEEGTDFEGYYETNVPFDYLWLREQIISGGGKVYRTVLDVPREDYSNTIIITDDIVETPNYLFAVSLGIPIYRHDVITKCCIQGKEFAHMKNNAMKMPNGRSLDTGQWFETSALQPLKGFSCLICLNVNPSTARFWKQLIINSGGTVIGGNAIQKIIGHGSQISFIVGDAALSEEVLNLAENYEIPIVSTIWVIQTVIHGKPRNYGDHKEYRAHYILFQEEND